MRTANTSFRLKLSQPIHVQKHVYGIFLCKTEYSKTKLGPSLNLKIVKPKSKVQSPKVKTKRTWAGTKITWATTPPITFKHEGVLW